MEFFLRFNVVGVGRFSISLYGEVKRSIHKTKASNDALFINKNKIIVEDYIEGLKTLSNIYDDELLLRFVDDFQTSDFYINGFNKSIALAKLRNVPESAMMKSKADIDSYFLGGN